MGKSMLGIETKKEESEAQEYTVKLKGWKTEHSAFIRPESEESCIIRSDRYYTRKHMWAQKTGNGNFKVGITDYAQKFIKENASLIQIFKNPIVGNEVNAGEAFGVIYGGIYANMPARCYEYRAFELTAPVNGKIIKINPQVMSKPKLVNESPYDEGWIAIIASANQPDISELITPEKYREILQGNEKSPFKIV